jgi:hypothetical protein
MRGLSAVMLGAVAAFGVGCGGSNPGGGTGNLFVRAEARSDGSTEGTSMIVHVRERDIDGPIVSDANVSIRGDHTGEATLLWDGFFIFDWAIGAYTSNIPWDTGWALNVRRDPDGLDAYLYSPGITEITEPNANTTFRRAEGEPLLVQWRDEAGHRAETVNVELEDADFNQPLRDDPLELRIEPHELVQSDNERLEVSRFTSVELAGGAPGSVFTATTYHSIRINIE